ncbi:DJ-1/PfpI family protein [Nonomuraea sp. NPDC048826]|uniref:DJ-1/PfpI family protein n=1 Tax=Nonomuraea sp. NPDC048826 TaxID=3364347 RepID=UPI00371AAD71
MTTPHVEEPAMTGTESRKSRWIRRAAVALAALLLPGVVSAVNTVGKFGDLYEARTDSVAVAPAPRSHDPDKPTVAFLTSVSGTNVADLLGPYEVLAGTGWVNVYTVSADAPVVPLTGGLDLVTDLSIDGLGRLLDERGDKLDAVVIPALHRPTGAEVTAINAWLRQQSAAGTLIVSVCHGARTFAGSGLLEGRPATSHWWRMAALRRDFPGVDWRTGHRYVEDGNVITTAGVLSGVDGGLRIVERLLDPEAAREAADRVHWRHYTPGAPAPLPESRLEPRDVVVAINSSYQTGPSAIGVQLVEGTGELELAAPFVSYTEEAMVGRTVAVGDGPIRSRHGLTFVPRAADAAGLDRLIVPGVAAALQRVAGDEAFYLHQKEEFAFDPVLRDIAGTYDVRTARWTAKTLEYTALDFELTGRSWPWTATLVPVLLALLGAACAIVVARFLRRRTP